MRAASIAFLLAGCSVFGTSKPHPMWRAHTYGLPPDCIVASAPVAIDAVMALAATAIVIGMGTRDCGGFESHDDSCKIQSKVATTVGAPLALGYGMSALVGHSRNQACESARTAYMTANPGWPAPGP